MQNNPLTEIGAIVLAALLIIAGGLLLYVAKIDTAYAMSMFLLAGGIFAGNLALKAPSPGQQSQLIAQHQSLQDMMSQVLSALPALFQQASTPPPVVVNNQIPPVQQSPQPVPPMPVAPQVAQVPFVAGNTFPQPVMPQ